MAGRGRARGNSSFLTFEQTQAMGIGRGEGVPGPNLLGPPPLFPKLENRPLPLQMDAAMDYMLILKRQYIDFLHDSPSFVLPITVKTDIERYSDKYKVLSNEGKSLKESTYLWANMPTELRPHQMRKGNKESRKRKLPKPVDIETRLKKLEQKELNEKDTVKQEGATNVTEKNTEENDQDSEKEEGEDPDEEMDDGTDYVDNYFDNGEGFEDEDENLDDGPVY